MGTCIYPHEDLLWRVTDLSCTGVPNLESVLMVVREKGSSSTLACT